MRKVSEPRTAAGASALLAPASAHPVCDIKIFLQVL